MKNDKSTGNVDLTKEFYETFWEETKTPFFNSIGKYFLTEELSTSQMSLANRLQVVMPNLVSENQSAYVNNRFISEGGRLTFDILEITDSLQIDGLLMTTDIEKAFDSVNHFFLIFVLKRYGFGDEFIKWN